MRMMTLDLRLALFLWDQPEDSDFVSFVHLWNLKSAIENH